MRLLNLKQKKKIITTLKLKRKKLCKVRELERTTGRPSDFLIVVDSLSKRMRLREEGEKKSDNIAEISCGNTVSDSCESASLHNNPSIYNT
jgi:hypothetical protein